MAELIKRSCDEERRLALLHSLDEPLANVYIPRCLEDGRWRQSQCHNATRYCWCVEEDSGIPIPGMATYNVEPNCTVKKVDRKMKGSSKKIRKLYVAAYVVNNNLYFLISKLLQILVWTIYIKYLACHILH